MRISVIGTGYVGLVSGTCLAEIGNDVTCIDIDVAKVAELNRGESPIYEPGLTEMIQRNARDGRLSFTTSYADGHADCALSIIAVGTPPSEDGGADMSAVWAAARSIAEAMTGPLTVVVKSTVPVGTSARVRQILSESGTKHPFEVVSNPEFLKEGRAIDDFMRPDRIVVGADTDGGAAVMRDLYRHFIRNGHTYLEMDTRSSEMTKYVSNVMLATRISLMNEMAQICENVGADIMKVRKGVGTDARIGMQFLYPGVGYGGSCFPKDVKALARLAVESDCPADILDAVERVNRHQKVSLANRLIKRFGGDLRGRRVGLWGIAFKPKTDDIREAPALAIIKRLLDAGATVCAYDPEATDNARRHFGNAPEVEFAPNPYEAARNADALLLVTEWAVFRSLDFDRVKGLLKEPVLYDGRNQYEPERMRELGFEYHCIGRPEPQ